MRSRSAILFTALSALTAGLFLLDLAVGAVRIPVADVWAALVVGAGTLAVCVTRFLTGIPPEIATA